MGWFSGPTQKELERAQQKELKSNSRDLDRDLRSLTLQEQKLTAEIKVLAKKNQEDAAKILAKQILDIRQHKNKLMAMKGQISSASTQSKQIKGQNLMAKSLASTTAAMKLSNQQLNPQQTQAMMTAFEKESMKMEMGSDMMNDTLDSVFDSAEADEDEDDLVSKVYDEIGLEFSQSVKSTPRVSEANSQKSSSKITDEDIYRSLMGIAQYTVASSKITRDLQGSLFIRDAFR